MAIYHCSIKSISRGQGHSVTAAAAYRAGIRIEDDTTGLIHDYTRKKGVVSVDMLAPADAPTWVADPSMLWNAAEVAETRKNARVGREMIVALPHEMSDTQRRELAIGIGQMLVGRYMVATQIALHAPDKGAISATTTPISCSRPARSGRRAWATTQPKSSTISSRAGGKSLRCVPQLPKS